MFWGDDMNVEKNMFTIGEMAKSIGITRKIILNYEAKGLITPDVKDGKNGNRYYTVDTFTKIRTVRILQKLGLSLDEIHAYLDGETDLLPLIRRLEAMRDEINLNIEKLYERANTNPTQIKEIHIDKQTIYRRTFTTESILDKTNILRDTAILGHAGSHITVREVYRVFDISVLKKDRRTNHRYLRPQKSILRYCKNRKKTLDQRLHHIRQRYRIAVKIQTPAR